jgi:hypothetical protein
MLKVHITRLGLSLFVGGCLILTGCPGQLSTDDPCQWIKPGKDHPLCPQWLNDTASDSTAPDASEPTETSLGVLNVASDLVEDDIPDDVSPEEDTYDTGSEDTEEWDTGSMSDTAIDASGGDDSLVEDIGQDAESDVQVEVCESFATSIQPLLDADCVICHKEPNGSFGLFLTEEVAISALVDKFSAYDPSLSLVTAFEPEASFLVDKLQDGPVHGTKMPLGKAAWSASQIQLITDWILAGATSEPFNCDPSDEP